MWTHRSQVRKSREELAQMSTEQLKEIIGLDSQGAGAYTTEDVFYILDLLGQREEKESETHVDVDAAWSRFQREYLHQGQGANAPVYTPKVRRRRRPSHVLGASAAALALVVVGLLSAQAAGWDMLAGFANWNDEIFTFGNQDMEMPVEEASMESATVTWAPSQQPEAITPEVSKYDTLQEALDACGITEIKAPAWRPEGYQFQTAERISHSDGMSYELYARYEGQGEVLVINILPSGPSSASVEKVEGNVDITDIHGQTVYIIENAHDWTIAWEMSGYECYLSGAHPQILEQMAASIINDLE